MSAAPPSTTRDRGADMGRTVDAIESDLQGTAAGRPAASAGDTS